MTDPGISVGEAWNRQFRSGEAGQYHFSEGLPFLRSFIRSPFIQLPARYANLAPSSQVLEAGCGSGKFSFAFALLGHAVTALDFSSEILENVIAAKAVLERDVGPLEVTVSQGDLENLHLPGSQFDLVINEGVVEHWLDAAARREVLAAMARVTKPRGAVVVIVPNGSHPYIKRWIGHHPAFVAAPPMVEYSPTLLADDFAAVGLHDIQVDGIYAWRTLGEWPNTSRAIRLAGSALDHTIPLPHGIRTRWGLHLIAMGRKA